MAVATINTKTGITIQASGEMTTDMEKVLCSIITALSIEAHGRRVSSKAEVYSTLVTETLTMGSGCAARCMDEECW